MRRALAVAAVAAPLFYLRRRAAARERVEVVFADGSAVSLDRGEDAHALLEIARSAL